MQKTMSNKLQEGQILSSNLTRSLSWYKLLIRFFTCCRHQLLNLHIYWHSKNETKTKDLEIHICTHRDKCIFEMIGKKYFLIESDALVYNIVVTVIIINVWLDWGSKDWFKQIIKFHVSLLFLLLINAA